MKNKIKKLEIIKSLQLVNDTLKYYKTPTEFSVELENFKNELQEEFVNIDKNLTADIDLGLQILNEDKDWG